MGGSSIFYYAETGAKYVQNGASSNAKNPFVAVLRMGLSRVIVGCERAR
jgi:hypothetical protein